MNTQDLVALVKKNPITVGCAVVTIGLAVALYFGSDDISDASKQLDERSALAQRQALNISYGAQLKEHYDAIAAANKVIESRLLRASDIGINQQFFYKLEADSGVKLLDLRQGSRGPIKDGLTAIAFNVSLQGDFPQVVTFLRMLEDGAHYCRVVSLSCSGGRVGPVMATLQLEILGRP